MGSSTGLHAAFDRYRYGILLVAAVGGTALLEMKIVPGAPTTIVVGAIAVTCAVELSRMLRAAGMDPFARSSLSLAIGMVITYAVGRLEQSFHSEAAVSVVRAFGPSELFLAAFVFHCIGCVLRRTAEGAASALAGGALVLVVPAALLAIVEIRYFGGAPGGAGLELVLFLVAVSKIGDIAAYIVGTAIGRHKLIPAVSPGKTWEGTIASLLAACGLAAILGSLGLVGRLPAERAVLAGVAINVASQFGDLTESLLKRSAGVKDSGSWIPQFGGAFDLVDSLFLAAPVFYGFLHVVSLQA